MADLHFRPAALADLDAVFEVIAADQPARAHAFVEAILARCAGLKACPESGPARLELGEGVRILPMFRRVVVACRLRDGEVEVLRVFYGGRDHALVMRDARP